MDDKQQQPQEESVQVDANVTTEKKDSKTEDDNLDLSSKNQVNETFNVPPKIEEKQEHKDNDNGGNVSLLKAREGNIVSSEDHKKCENAFKAAKISSLSPDQKNDIHKYEDNLIKMARNNEKGDIIEIAKERFELHIIDAKLLATELIERFGKSLQSNGM